MIEVNYDFFDEKCLQNYLQFLISKFYKILPMSETHSKTLKTYLESLQIELMGNIKLIDNIKHDAQFLTLLGTIQYFIDNDCPHNIYKREIFKCISILEKLKNKYFKEGDGEN